MRTKVCEYCRNGIRIKRGYFVRAYEEPPEKHIYHLVCFKIKIVDEQHKRKTEREEMEKMREVMT